MTFLLHVTPRDCLRALRLPCGQSYSYSEAQSDAAGGAAGVVGATEAPGGYGDVLSLRDEVDMDWLSMGRLTDASEVQWLQLEDDVRPPLPGRLPDATLILTLAVYSTVYTLSGRVDYRVSSNMAWQYYSCFLDDFGPPMSR